MQRIIVIKNETILLIVLFLLSIPVFFYILLHFVIFLKQEHEKNRSPLAEFVYIDIMFCIQYAVLWTAGKRCCIMNAELIVFILYLLFMLGIGVYFFVKGRGTGEKEYFLGGRKMGPWVSALSAGASDMSAWVLMGLPASIYAYGIGQSWIAIGLAIGYALSWIFEAPRLRRFSIAADDSITLPQYLTNRFKSSSKVLQILCAVIFLVAYTIYAASSVKACGTLFNTVIGLDPTIAMYIAAAIIVAYTFMGGFSAVCWTDFFQGLLMLGALLIAPIFALGMLNAQPGHMTMEALADVFNVPLASLVAGEDQLARILEDYYTPEDEPRTPEARILAKGIDSMPKEQREAILNMMMGLYPNVFNQKGTDDDDT